MYLSGGTQRPRRRVAGIGRHDPQRLLDRGSVRDSRAPAGM